MSHPTVALQRGIESIVDGPFGSNLASKHYTEDGVRVVRLGNIGAMKFRDKDKAFISTDRFEMLRRHSIVPGDVLVAGLGDEINAVGRACVAPPDIAPALVKADCFRLRLLPAFFDSRYIAWFLNSSGAAAQVELESRGATRVRATPEAIARVQVPLLDLNEQRRIADFLDDQVTRIDKIIEARGRQMALTVEEMENRWAETALPLAPLVPLRRFLVSITDGPFGSALTSAHYADEGTRVIRLGNVGIATFRDLDKAYIPPEYGATLSQHAVSPGDLLMAGLGDERWPLGRCVVAPSNLGRSIVKADCYRIRLDKRLSPSFAAWYLSSPVSRTRFQELARGSTRARLNTQLAREALVPVVPKNLQAQIVAAFDVDRESAETSRAGLIRSQHLLEELKRSLITAAVTGEFDVSSADGSRVPV